jgi:hypothetical protein
VRPLRLLKPKNLHLHKKTEELTATLKAEKIEEPRAEGTKTSEILSPSAEVEVPKTQKSPAMTPKRKKDG